MNEAKARRLLADRSDGLCEACGQARAGNAHHRQNRSQGGVWSPENLLHLCGSGTTGCHGQVTERVAWARMLGWSVPSWSDPLHVPVLHARHGLVYLTPEGGVSTIKETA